MSKYPIPDVCDTFSFDHPLIKKPYINFSDRFPCLSPKFHSLYSTLKTNYGPIFLKQKGGRIKIKAIKCRDITCFICKSKSLKTSKDEIKCALFDQYIR